MLYRERLNKLRNRANNLYCTVQDLKSNKARYDSLKSQVDSLNGFIELASTYNSVLHNTMIATRDKYSKYQQDRIKFLEIALESNINYLFPDRGFTPKINYEIFRNKIKSELILIDPDRNIRTPEITEGDFLKQLIGYTSSISILELLNCKTFYIDEAFSNASSLSKEKMQPIIYKYTKENNLQTIMISQSNECYLDLPRREFLLEFINNECKLIDVIDYDIEFNPSDFEESLDVLTTENSELNSEDLDYLGSIDNLN